MFSHLEVNLAAALRRTQRWTDDGPCWCELQRRASALKGQKLHSAACLNARLVVAKVPADARAPDYVAEGGVTITRELQPCLHEVLDLCASSAGEGGFEEYAIHERWEPWLPYWEKMLLPCCEAERRLLAGDGRAVRLAELTAVLAGKPYPYAARPFAEMLVEFVDGDMG